MTLKSQKRWMRWRKKSLTAKFDFEKLKTLKKLKKLSLLLYFQFAMKLWRMMSSGWWCF